MKEDVDGSMQAGFSYHITKPVNWTDLKSAIEKIAKEANQKSCGSTEKLV